MDIDFNKLDTNSVVKDHIKQLQGDGFYRPERSKTLARQPGTHCRIYALANQAATDESNAFDALFLRSLGIEANITPKGL